MAAIITRWKLSDQLWSWIQQHLFYHERYISNLIYVADRFFIFKYIYFCTCVVMKIMKRFQNLCISWPSGTKLMLFFLCWGFFLTLKNFSLQIFIYAWHSWPFLSDVSVYNGHLRGFVNFVNLMYISREIFKCQRLTLGFRTLPLSVPTQW